MFAVSDRVEGVRWMLCFVAFLAIGLLPKLALAAEGSIQLVWNAPIGCPDREAVLAAIRELMGGTGGSANVSVRVDVARTDSRLVLKLVLKTPTAASERTMESTKCDELARGAALVVALAAGPEAPSEGREPSPSAPSAATTPIIKDRLDDGKTVARRGRSLTWAPRAALAFDVGSLRRPALGAALGVRLDLPFPFSVGVEALFLAPQTVSTVAGGGKFWGTALAARPCLRLQVSNFYLWPCGALDLEMMVANGEGLSSTQQGIVWFLRVGGGAEVAYAFSRRVRLVTGAWLLYGPSRPTFVVNYTIPVHSPAPLAGRLTTGLSLVL